MPPLHTKMPNNRYLYSFKYDYHLAELCRLESRQIFNAAVRDKLLISTIKVDPSISAFIKTRLQITSTAVTFAQLTAEIKKENLRLNGFNVEYLICEGDTTERTERRKKLKDIGYCIEGYPDFKTPDITYAICQYEGVWYFGSITTHNNDWYKHKQKPHSFSNSIGMDSAKTLVSIAAKGDKSNTLLDACCGVGTTLLEACCAGFYIEGCDISPGAANYSKLNLAHYNYVSTVYCSDIKDLDISYDAAIVDLPYNLYSRSDEEVTRNIIASTAQLTTRVVIVSIADITDTIQKSGLTIIDFCTILKKGKSTFTRKVWVCERT